MTKRHRHDHDDEQSSQQPAEQPEGGEVQPGCSEPGTVAPSVTGTSQDPKRKKED